MRREFCQLIGHGRNVGRFERGVGANDPHRNPDVGGGERRRVVDAVSHHRETAKTRLKFFDSGEFLLRQSAAR